MTMNDLPVTTETLLHYLSGYAENATSISVEEIQIVRNN